MPPRGRLGARGLSRLPPDCSAKFTAVRSLASGGHGEVLLATQLELDRPIVIKLLHALDPDERRRFDDEARIAASLSSPHIAKVIDHGAGDVPWIAYELIEGGRVAGPLPPATVIQIGIQMALALEVAHAKGILHRDVKPDNILQASPELWKLTDFGISRWDGSSRVPTAHGMVLGTPAYLAPEVIRGESGDAGQDLYALGCTLYELIAGRPPFQHESVMQVLELHLAAPPPPLATFAAHAPSELESVVSRCIAKERRHRYSGAAELAEALRRLEPGPAGNLAASQQNPAASRGGSRPDATLVLRPVAARSPAPLLLAGAAALLCLAIFTLRLAPRVPNPSATAAPDPLAALTYRLASYTPARPDLPDPEVDVLFEAVAALPRLERRLPLNSVLEIMLVSRVFKDTAASADSFDDLLKPYRDKDVLDLVGAHRGEIPWRIQARREWLGRLAAADPAATERLRARFRERRPARMRGLRALLALDLDLYDSEIMGSTSAWELALSGLALKDEGDPWEQLKLLEEGRPSHWMLDYMRAYLKSAAGDETSACLYARRALKGAREARMGDAQRAGAGVSALIGNMREVAPSRGNGFRQALEEGKRLADNMPPGARLEDGAAGLLSMFRKR